MPSKLLHTPHEISGLSLTFLVTTLFISSFLIGATFARQSVSPLRSFADASCSTVDGIGASTDTIAIGEDFQCFVTVAGGASPAGIGCGLKLNDTAWPSDICRQVSDGSGGNKYGFQGYTGGKATFKCNTNCVSDSSCNPNDGFTSGTYTLIGFDYRLPTCGPTVAPDQGKVTSLTFTGGNSPAPTAAESTPIPTNTPIPQCGNRCIYSQKEKQAKDEVITRCYVGNCKDPSKPCGFNDNCWFNDDTACGISGDKGKEVSCESPTLPPEPTSIPEPTLNVDQTPPVPTIPAAPSECLAVDFVKKMNDIFGKEVISPEDKALIILCEPFGFLKNIKIDLNWIPGSRTEDPGKTLPPTSDKPRCFPLSTGPCSVENLKKYFGDEQTAKEASIVCNRESGGLSNGADNQGCLKGLTPEYSVGLFQINTIFASRCPAGIPAIINYNITPTPPPPLYHCETNDEVDPELKKSYFEICREFFKDPDQNIKFALGLYNSSGRTWHKHWGPDARDCNLR